MGLKESFEKAKQRLLNDTEICKENRNLFKEFFEFQEHKEKRTNELAHLDDGCYKTLLGYTIRLRTVNRWFNNKPWKDLTKEDIQKVYDNLEDGNLKTNKGKPYKDKRSYYNNIFKSKPFKLAGHKDDLAREVLEYYTDKKHKDVRFLDEERFRKLISVLSKPEHLLLFWLAWDIGENVTSLLELKKKDFTKQMNRHTKSSEYLVNLPQGVLKRSRQTRSELTLYPETVRYIDIILERGKKIFVQDKNGKETTKVKKSDGKYTRISGRTKYIPFESNDNLFTFEKRQATKIFDAVVEKTGVKTIPNNDKPTWKDIRNSMACHLMKNGWHSDEINLRLGHTITSRELNVYVSYLAANKQMPKKKLFQSNLEEVQDELEQSKQREKLNSNRQIRLKEELDVMKEENEQMKSSMEKKIREITEMIKNQTE